MSRANPEHRLQVEVRRFLEFALPASIYWTSSLTGASLSMNARLKAKAAGVRRGLPDLLFVFPDGVTRFLELKTATGTLTPEQKDFRARFEPLGIFRVARSVQEVEAALRAWGAPLRATTDLKPFLGDPNNSAKLFDDIAD